MDITILFKACVKTVRTTNKNLGRKEESTNILKISRDTNLSKAKEIVKQIGKLHDFLIENRMGYLNVVNYLSTNKTMTELDRQEVDTVAQTIINNCTTELTTCRQTIHLQKNTKQKEEHYENVIDSIDRYLKQVSKIYTEAKAVRVKRVLEAHKLSKLETKPDQPTSKDPVRKPSITVPMHTHETVENQLSPEEMQMFESENDLMFDELNSLSDEVKQIESKVVHISELQELFTEKVLQQEQDIERIATTVVKSTDDMKDANEQIRQAIQRNAGLRVWVLFFLLVMSFSLLFLDWYND
ncbi:hypothetical protein PPYR_06228 [Photinus pyralis]|uniref:Syntaxin-18 n=1 Tax=Photinus pyralis TaxID=7054 RepID=A0A1Y1L5E4_PHOPY|nr:syntaxin-18 [Photinus pyralis]KAB0800488.1 hypothetical protein PPYR_06228 [Photinus pyralis]